MNVLTYGNETMIWREKERSRILAVQMDNLRSFWVSGEWNPLVRQLCGVSKGIDEKIDKGKVLSGGSPMWREWRMTGLLRG